MMEEGLACSEHVVAAEALWATANACTCAPPSWAIRLAESALISRLEGPQPRAGFVAPHVNLVSLATRSTRTLQMH
jgi:hypothetical protein